MSEYWVDVPKVEMTPRSAWGTLGLNGLLEAKNQLLDKLHMARGNQAYLLPLNAALQELEALIAQKMSDPRGD